MFVKHACTFSSSSPPPLHPSDLSLRTLTSPPRLLPSACFCFPFICRCFCSPPISTRGVPSQQACQPTDRSHSLPVSFPPVNFQVKRGSSPSLRQVCLDQRPPFSARRLQPLIYEATARYTVHSEIVDKSARGVATAMETRATASGSNHPRRKAPPAVKRRSRQQIT